MEKQLTAAQLNDLRVTARKVFDKLVKESERFCYRHELDGDMAMQRTLLTIQEAMTFAVLANYLAEEDRIAALDSLKGGLLMRLKEFSQQPGQFVKYDS